VVTEYGYDSDADYEEAVRTAAVTGDTSLMTGEHLADLAAEKADRDLKRMKEEGDIFAGTDESDPPFQPPPRLRGWWERDDDTDEGEAA
jgi:hypothetical protein